MKAQDRKVSLSGNLIPCPACGSKKEVRWFYEDIVLAIFHWPTAANCRGCGWNYERTEPDVDYWMTVPVVLS